MKKFLYAGVLIGTIFLTACNANDETQEQLTESMIMDIKDVPEATLVLTEEQKQDYYEQYVEIIKEVNLEYGGELELSSFEEFTENEEWWVEPEDLREIATDMKNAVWTAVDDR